jgi:threo-3-hydroxy-L-aspartate ammonia-lyase
VDLVDAEALTVAAGRLAGRVVRTPLLPSARLSDEFGVPVLLKAENLQHTGAFKVRGMMNAMLARAASDRPPAGVTTFSAGNAAAATSYAARALGIPAIVCMPPGAVESKIEAVRRYGGEIVFTDDLVGTCHRIAEERNFLALHPFDDPDVIAGHGTAGVELMADCPDPALILVPVGGGGLISGISAAVRAAQPTRTAKVVGVEPATANAMTHALATGEATPPPTKPASIADGLAAPFAGPTTLAHVQANVDDVVTIEETAIRDSWWSLIDATKLLVEPSAVVGLAALRVGAVPVPASGPIVLVISGGNAARTGIADVAGT